MNPTALRIAVPASLTLWAAVAGIVWSSEWLWVAAVAALAAVVEVYVAHRLKTRDVELEEILGRPLPPADAIDPEYLELHRRPWSEEGP